MMRNRTLRALTAAASFALVPAALSAQQAAGGGTPSTHTVVAGETLWSLAQQYLSDPYRWREIYDLNKANIADPHWIYPGQVLKLPGAVTSVAVTVAPAPALTAPAAAAAPPPSEPTLDPARSRTVFSRQQATVRPPETMDQGGPAMPTVRMGEYVRAPFVGKTGSASGGGQLLKSAELDANGDFDSRTIFKAYDRVMISVPAGTDAKVGDRFVVVSDGDVLPGQGQVFIPTGVVQVTTPPANGTAAVAEVVELFGEMNPGQRIAVLDTAGVSSTASPAPVADGRTASIQWVLASPVLPTMQSYAVLNLTQADGVHPGDEFLVYRPRGASDAPGEPANAEVPIGRAQAIKVTPYGTTAIVIAQEQPAINVGSVVRVSAKMP
jgi:LysM repeat protein